MLFRRFQPLIERATPILRRSTDQPRALLPMIRSDRPTPAEVPLAHLSFDAAETARVSVGRLGRRETA
jgi:hypothetical protein